MEEELNAGRLSEQSGSNPGCEPEQSGDNPGCEPEQSGSSLGCEPEQSGDIPGCGPERIRGGIPDLAEVIASGMNLPQKDWSQYPPLSLAWIGDTVFDLIIRSILLRRGMTQTDRLHRKAAEIVNARAQAGMMRRIREKLTEEEQVIYRRGHNAKPAHKAKNADMSEYLEATAFECLVGWLYLNARYERILELIKEEL